MKDKDTEIANIVLDIVRAANLLERLGGHYAKEAGLSSVQQYMILSLLSHEEGLSISDLKQNTLVTKQAITGLVDRLNQKGYLETYRDSDDRRITRVRLTQGGEQALKTILPHRISGNREAFSILNDEEYTQLSVILPKLIQHLQDI